MNTNPDQDVRLSNFTITVLQLDQMPQDLKQYDRVLATIDAAAVQHNVRILKVADNRILAISAPTDEGRAYAATWLAQVSAEHPDLKWRAGQSQGEVAQLSPMSYRQGSIDLAGHHVVEAYRLANCVEASQGLIAKIDEPLLSTHKTIEVKGIGEISYAPIDMKKAVAIVKPIVLTREQEETIRNTQTQQRNTVGNVLECDIKNFSGITKDMTPQQSGVFAQTCRTEMNAILEKHGFKMSSWGGDGFVAIKEGKPDPDKLIAINREISETLMPAISKVVRSWGDQFPDKVETRMGASYGDITLRTFGVNTEVLGSTKDRAFELERTATPGTVKMDEVLIALKSKGQDKSL